MNNELTFLQTKNKRLLFSFLLVVGFVFLLNFVEGVQSEVFCTGAFGTNTATSCNAFEYGLEGLLGFVGFSGYFLLLPILIPVLIIWTIMEAVLKFNK